MGRVGVDARNLVKNGYNEIAAKYLSVRTKDSDDVRLLQMLVEGLPVKVRVLDDGHRGECPYLSEL